MKAFRRHFVGLPLQRSLFSEIDRVPEVIGQTGVLPGGRLRAWLDEDGDLFLDRSDVERLAATLRECLTPALLEHMQRSLAAACDAVREATERCGRLAPLVEEPDARALLGELGAKLSRLIPYGILSKFVPDVLYRGFVSETGDPTWPLPSESPGAALTRAALALYLDCRARGCSPERLLAEWPDVQADVAARVRDFCGVHAGFGPLSWDAPGYEEPHYVLAVLRATFAELDAEELSRFASMIGARPAAAADAGGAVGSIRRVLAMWIAFLERETWYVRRAFYVGVGPLIRRLAPAVQRQHPGFAREDLLFLELHELTSPAADLTQAPLRRARYLANTAYLAEQGITTDRLRAILEAA